MRQVVQPTELVIMQKRVISAAVSAVVLIASFFGTAYAHQ